MEPRARFELAYPDYGARHFWSQRGYSKPQPPRYGRGALPLELLRPGAGGDNRNLFSGLEAQGTPYIPRPPDANSIVKDLLCDTSTVSLPTGNKLDKMPQIPGKNKKRGGHFVAAPVLETGILFQDG